MAIPKSTPAESKKFYQTVSRFHMGQAKNAAGRGDVGLADLHFQAALKASAEVRALKATVA